MTRTQLALALSWPLVLAACGGDDVPATPDAGGEERRDASTPADAGSSTCAADAECDDGFYCNGVERCMPSSAAANARGCVLGTPPCAAASCDEAADRCAEGCVDADGDGAEDVACGGDDCDDDDPQVFPGNPEVCDREGRDEDCDPDTLGHDLDSDGHVSDRCCNLQLDGELLCGADCDDESSDIRPGVVDICGNGDQDCDGAIDEDPDDVFYADADGDGFGDASMTAMACGAPLGYVLIGTDCDDTDSDVSPGVEERCDSEMVDEDCDGEANEGCGCAPAGATRLCTGSSEGVCQPGTQTCIVGGDSRTLWGTCEGRVEPQAEICNGLDDDCNGTPDDGATFQCRFGDPPSTGTNACGRTASRTCDVATCRWAPQEFRVAESASTCDYCDDSGAGLAAESAFATESASGSLGSATYFMSDAATLTRTTGYVGSALAIGYGDATFEVAVSVDEPTTIETRHGWAMLLVREDLGSSSPLVGDHGDSLAVPLGRDGLSVEWRFYDVANRANLDDSLVLRHLRASASDPIVATTANPGPDAYTSPLHGGATRRNQRVRVRITPDMPGDAADDTEVVVEYYEFAAWQPAMACGGAATACPFTIASGERYHFGLTHSTGYTPGNVNDSVVISITSSSIVREGLCP